ncbi:hypothetical protein B0A54_01668 [Friedmanniomyces endolithicus]|uniref:protein disulfide-isomerase n=1 Tax=Friedmanniomyces endolithicus TaxID=329885 RepID=A0A4U0VIN1_9PEZI|nr:hypothetical protein LTS09_006294 [Friedmanniomyces endolithicus]TKA48175.1 hypothetical protein B0A54_01668 [Friedmanniomyces endolithicus]
MLSPVTTLSLSLALLLLPSTLADGLYSKTSPVLQLSGQSYRSLIEQSNHTTIIEFYAPWCGHCKNLQPAYEKAAKSLAGLAKVGAVNCDAEENKPFCGSMGVQGFPTLKIVRPGKKVGKPTVEDYRGERTAKGIVDAVVEKMPNHVRRLKNGDYEAWLAEGGEGRPKAMLFSEKASVSALLKAVAVDFLGAIDVAQIRNREAVAMEAFKVEKSPTLVLLPGAGKAPVHYDGDMKKEAIVAFLSQAASPNADPAPKEKKAKTSSSSSTNKSKASKASSSFSKASASHESQDSQSAKPSQTSETLENDSNPTESPNPKVATDKSQQPIKVPDIAPPITSLPDGLSLQQRCLNSRSSTCLLALLPENPTPDTATAISSLSTIHHKHTQGKRILFPFYQLPASNSQAAAIRSKLSLASSTVEILAVNGKRGWYRHYPSTSFSQNAIEDWVDAVRMGDTPKHDLPSGLVVPADSLPTEPIKMDFGSVEGLREAMKGQMPEGMGFEVEEIDDEMYERLMKQEGGKENVPPQEEGYHEL